MPQADSENSTPMPAAATRRRFLSQAAGVAAGGTALALATVSATAGAAAPVASLASSDIDPILALIEEYRTAAKTAAAAASEHSSREDMLIEQGLALNPFVAALDVSGPGRPQPIVAYKHEYIDRLLPADRFSKPNAAAHASLDAQIERHKAIVGDSEDVLYAAAQDAETEALDTLVWTQQTTSRCSRITGIVAGTATLTRYGRRPDRRYHNLCYRRVCGTYIRTPDPNWQF